MNSQTQDILAYLKEGNSLTPIDALEKFGCFRLSGRVYDIKKLGYEIEMKMVGGKKKYAEYKLKTQ